MTDQEKTAGQITGDRLVAVHSAGEMSGAEKMFFIFTTSQVEEVLAELPVSPVPFTPPFLDGMCRWRKRFVPVLDLEQRLGITSEDRQAGARFMVVRTAAPDDAAGSRILHCALKVSDRIITLDIPDSDAIRDEDVPVVNKQLTRGVFRHDENVLVAPDLLAMLDMQNCFDKGE